MYTENYKTLLKEIKDLNKWKNILRSGIGRHDTVNTAIFTELINRFSAIPTEIPTDFLSEIDMLILKFMWKGNGF